jgi:serine/threonine protein kinase/tetratricopeptide (TPR) repeat protein
METNPVDEEAIFAAALEKTSPDERRAFLAEACTGDTGLRGRVEALLYAHENPDSYLEPRDQRGIATADYEVAEPAGPVIGPYKLIEEIGEGGMGSVFMAQQTEPVKRLVALKVIKPGMDSRQIIARFEAERQALALMDHPNIARVFDAGTTETGKPYFVMELVKGVPLTRYCDEHRLTPKERLEQFIPVCQAIQHAHQKGIIHRDIKPSNVLVALYDGEPVPKVIDFGIAKAAGQQLTEKTLVTGFGAVVGTLEYMSPEQAELNQLDIDTRSDIYSLGVLLYELLTGTTPLDRKRLKEAAMLEVLRIIREEEPPKPSTRLSTMEDTATVAANRGLEPKKLSGLVRGELDWIVMKCLEKDRNRRYETAAALAADVRHYLHDEAVQACPPSAWYRFGKFARRNRVALAMASVVTGALVLLVASLAAGLVLLGRANTRIEEQRNLADENFREARRAVDDYLTRVSENRLLKSPVPGLQPLRKELLETALKYYQAFVAKRPDEPAVRSELARAYFRVGSIQEEVATKAEALRAYQASRGLWQRLVRDRPGNSECQQQLAECVRNIGRLQSRFLGQPAEGLQALHQAQGLYEQLARAEPKNHQFLSGLARTYGDLATWSIERGEGLEELRFHRKALELWQGLAEAEPGFRSQLGTTTMNLGYSYTRAGKAAEALASFDQARKVFATLCHDHPGDTALLGELRRVYVNIGFVHECLLSRYQDALRFYDQSRQILEQLTHDNPAVAEFQSLKAGIFKQIGSVLLATKDFERAERRFQQAVAILDRIVEADPGNAPAQWFRGEAYGLLGEAQLQLDHCPEALASAEKSRAIVEVLLRRDPNQLDYAIERSRSYELAACVYRKTGRWSDAIQCFRRAVELLEKVPWQPQSRRAVCTFISFYAGLGDVHREAGQRVGAERSYRQALDLGNKYLVETGDRTSRAPDCFYATWVSLGQLQIDSGNGQDARRTLQQARALMEKLPQPNGEDQYNLARVRAQLSRLAGSGQTALSASEQAERHRYLDQAVDALRNAIASGYRGLAELKKDTSLDPLRDRDDFHKLVAGLAAAKGKGIE